MKSMVTTFCLFILAVSLGWASELRDVVSKIKWITQACVRIEDKKIIYIDPYKLEGEPPKADIILITHDHMDHFDPSSIKLILKDSTIVIVPEKVNVKLKDVSLKRIKINTTMEIEGYKITAVPAYNIKKKMFHPKEKGYAGYIIEVDGVKIYHTGDTERIPEMKDLNVDIVLLPLGQTYTMNSVEEAVMVVKDVKAKIAIPIHYGLYEGKYEDAIKFQNLLKKEGIEVIILK